MPLITLLEAVEKQEGAAPDKWRVRLIEAGLSHNNTQYDLAVLHEAAPLFEGAKALARSDEDHIKDQNKKVKEIAGWFTDVTPVAEGLDATFHISADHDWLKVKAADAWENKNPGLFGFSIVAEALGRVQRKAGKMLRHVDRISKVRSVDVVVNPAAGGGFVGIAEAEAEEGANEMKLIERLLKLIEAKAPAEYAKLDLENIDEAKVFALVEALPAATLEVKEANAPAGAGEGVFTLAEAKEMITEATKGILEQNSRDRAEMMFGQMFAESGLPADCKDRVAVVLNGEKPATAEKVAEAINSEKAYLAKHTTWTGPGSTFGGSLAESIVDERDKFSSALTGLFMEADQPIDAAKEDGPKQARFISIKEAYITLTGDVGMTGMVDSSPRVGMHAEAAINSGTWSELLRDAMNKRMQKEYKFAPHDHWKMIADVATANDFRSNFRPQSGGFGDLDSVAEGAVYNEFGTAPGDFGPNYTIGKYGATKGVTLEAIANDDVGAIIKMPVRMGRAAARTLNKNIWNPILTNADVSWGANTPLFDALHGGNITTNALSPSAISSGRLTMRMQEEQDSQERLGLNPRYLFVPEELLQKAFEYCYTPSKPLLDKSAQGAMEAEGLLNFIKQMNLTPIALPNMTDANNWIMTADKGDIGLVEVGFFGGKETPELFLQDMPNMGSMFTNDTLTYKIRHIYGIAVLDYRGFYMGNVT